MSLTTAERPVRLLLVLDKYTAVNMQFSRGCPYRCEFCDIIVMFGRRPRTKTPEQIGRELDLLRERAVHSVFFVDDNLIGNKKEAKRLLRYLADYQWRHDYRFSFSTEVSLNLADDEELLVLFRAANFGYVFIGIESPDAASLKETRKTQNLRQDMLTAVRTIYAHGIDVMAGFIIGFDEELDNDRIHDLERQIGDKLGVYSACMHEKTRHLMVVDFNATEVQPSGIVQAFRGHGINAQMIGM